MADKMDTSELDQDCCVLERIFLSIVMADTDEQFEKCLTKFLPHILSKAASPSETVRAKVVEVLSHISKRVKATKNVQLPVETLLDIYEKPQASIFLINFTIIYIKMGFPRIPQEVKFKLLPRLVKTAANRPLAHQESFCLLVLSNLKGYPYPKDDEERKKLFGLNENPQIKKLLLDIVMDIFLFPYGCVGESNLTDISLYGYRRLTKDDFLELSADSLEQLKLSMIKFLGTLGTKDVYPHLVVSSSDARSSVMEAAESQLKMLDDLDYDDLSTVAPLYALYLKEGEGDSKVNSVNARTRMKLLVHISKFRVLAWPGSIKVLFESLYGTYSTPKLRSHALNFAASMIRHLPQEQIDQISPVLLNSALMKLIKEEQKEQYKQNKIQAYQLLSSLLLRCPSLTKKNLDPVEFVFKAIETEEDSDLRTAARDTAMSMAKAYKGIDPSYETFLYSLLSSKLFPVTRQQGGIQSGIGLQLEGLKLARSAAVRFVSDALNQSPLKIYTLLRAAVIGDEDSCAEAKKALYLTRKSKGNTKEELIQGFVPFNSLLSLVLNKEETYHHDSNELNEIVSYLRLCLAADAKVIEGLEPVTHPSDGSPLIRQKLLEYHTSDSSILPSYLNLLVGSLKSEPGPVCLGAIHELIGCLPDVLATHLLDKVQIFIELATSHNKDEVRLKSAEIASLLLPKDAAAKTVNSAVDNISTAGKDLEKIHGSIALISFIVGRYGGVTKEAVNSIKQFLDNPNQSLIAVTALGCMSQVEPLPLEKDEMEQLVNKLLEMLLNNKVTSKVKDKICDTLCSFCAAEIDFPFKNLIKNKLLGATKQIKDVDLCLSTGEVISTIVLGRASILSLDPWNRDTKAFEAMQERLIGGGSLAVEAEKACLAVESMIDSMSKMVKEDRHPTTRQVLCFWLLAITKQCGFLPVTEKRLPDIQNCFIDLLSDANALVQEGAGKGLALVYDATHDEEAKALLLKTVVNQLVAGRSSVVKVSEDTQLFQPDEMGQTPTGGKLSTYKELCQLASDLNQPDLIYKFMHLANHNAVWNSKKGAAYTISSLMSKASTSLDDQLPKIVVKLYRYQYDPVPNIQQSMAGVWASLASADTVEKYYLEICDDLLVNLTAVYWRVRISSCKAVQDFIRGPGGKKLLMHHPEKVGELWTQLLRVMDDIHEGTRNAATSTAKTLSKICITETKKGTGKAGEQLAGIVLKILLSNGLKSSVSEIRAVSTATVSEMVKEGLPKEEAPTVIISLLKCCADLGLANIYAPGAENSEALDKVRIPLLKSNNVVQALLACMPHVDLKLFESIHSDLADLLKGTSGFGTRIVTSHFIVLISHHLTKEEFQPYVGKFLGCLLNGLSDRSPGIRRQYASCIGQLLRTAKDSSVERLLEKFKTMYFDKDDENVSKAICHSLQAISMYSQDTIKDKEDLVLPLVLFAKHIEKLPDGSNASDVEAWNEVWNDFAFTNHAIINNEDAVVAVLETAIASQSWKIKAQMARTARTLGLKEDFSPDKRCKLTTLLLNALPGRTWEGKEHILQALGAMAKHPKGIQGTDLEQQLVEALLKECCKEKISYKMHAFSALGEVVENLETDRFNEIYPLLNEIISKDETTFDNGDKEDKERYDSRFALVECAYETLASCWPKTIETQTKYIEEIITEGFKKMGHSTPQVQAAIIACLSKISSKTRELLRSGDDVLVVKVVGSLIKVMDHCFSLTKNSKLKKEALNLLQSLQVTFRGRNDKEYARLQDLFNKFSASLGEERAPELKSRFADIKEMFNSETMMS